MDKYEIAVLADDLHTKRMRRDLLGLQNLSNDPEKQRQQRIEYHVADAEYVQALMALERAKHSVSET